jgi:hypothetical protein
MMEIISPVIAVVWVLTIAAAALLWIYHKWN